MPEDMQAPVSETDNAQDQAPTDAANPIDSKIAKILQDSVEIAKSTRRNLSQTWKTSVDLRMGQVAGLYTAGVSTPDDVQTTINPDWYMSKTKTASLFSQVPMVQVTTESEPYRPAAAPFAKALNYELGEKRCNVGVALEEVLNDVVNASGVGIAIVGYAARFETVQMPMIDVQQFPPEIVERLIADGTIPTMPVERPTDSKFFVNRLSPTNFLWPDDFTGSDFDRADWLGHQGRMNWAEAKLEFKLTDDQKERAITTDTKAVQDDLRSSSQKNAPSPKEVVEYDEIYYWRARQDPAEKLFKSIWRLVYVKGLDEPVVHEPWKGQQPTEDGKGFVGSAKLPIRVLTLTYVSDNAVPPSDSAAARPQVNDLRRDREQYMKNRQWSMPIRWFDSNRTDITIQDSLMRGDIQGMIPTNGPGDRVIGEIARAAYPPEDFRFAAQTTADLERMWMISPTQMGMTPPGERTAAEIEMTQANASTRLGQERARVSTFFLGIAEVLSGLMVLYSEFPTLTDEERQRMMQSWNAKLITHDMAFKIRPDSTVLLDSQARIQRLSQFLNLTVKSGYINPKPIIMEMAELSGIDPAQVVIDPQPPNEEPNVSWRFSGKDDLMSPFAIAMLIKEGQAPSAEQIVEAQQLLLKAQNAMPPAPPPMPGMGGPPQSGQEPVDPAQDAQPQWQLASKIAQRSEDMGRS
jgi:hypothetical protein